MKRILVAFVVLLTLGYLVNAQNTTTIKQDSIGKVKVTVTKKQSAKAGSNSTAVTVVGIDANALDSADIDDLSADSSYVSHGNTILSLGKDDSDFLFNHFGSAIGGGILVAIISIILVFGFPAFILFLIFFFRYKNRKARYRLAEQALAAGQPLPESLIKEFQLNSNQSTQSTQGIKNTFTGIGLFIFLWAITGEFGIGAIGLLVMFIGLGQWLDQRGKNNNIGRTTEEKNPQARDSKEKNEEN